MVLSKNAKLALLLGITAACASTVDRRRKRRSIWMKTWLERRRQRSSFATIFRELRNEDESSFINYTRMTPVLFSSLLDKISPLIKRNDTNMRESISPGARLEATLRFLANGGSYNSLQYSSRISQPSLSYIIPETCDAIYNALKDEYVKTPNSPAEWKEVARDFQHMWNFPNCIGSIDGKHITIRPPPGSGSYFFNYKGTNSIILMAVVDARYRFLYVDVGTNGRASDATVWDNCSLKVRVEDGTMGLPADSALPGSNKVLPHVFVGDDAFPLKPFLLKPFPFRSQNNSERIFSYRLSRARRTVENAFGIMANRFRCLLTQICLQPEKVQKIVLACVALHNFLMTENASEYSSGSMMDSENVVTGELQPGTWREQELLVPLQVRGRRAAEEAKAVRQQFCEYFNAEGSVPWQAKMAGIE